MKPMAYDNPEFAAVYIQHSSVGALRDHAALDEAIVAALGNVTGKRILDVGCGAGRWAARLIGAGAEVVGVEPSPSMADAAEALGLSRLTLMRCRAEEVAPVGTFDAVIAMMSLDHVEEVGEVLSRLQPHLKPGARVVISTEHPLRTAPRGGPRWTADPNGGRAARVVDYGKRGWREFHWFGRDDPIFVYHRSFGDWVRALTASGLSLLDVIEPVSSKPRDGGNPRFWALVAVAGG